jgi:hypothetical protein
MSAWRRRPDMERTDHPPPPGWEDLPRYYRSELDTIRTWLDDTKENHLLILESGFSVAYGCEDQVEVETNTLGAFMPSTRYLHRAFAVTPAPWAERPYAYVYPVAMDRGGPVLASFQVEPAWMDAVPREDWSALISALFGHN